MKNTSYWTGWLLLLLLTQSACIKHRELVNLNEGPAFSTTPEQIANLPVLTLQPDDLLAISVQSLDPQASAPFNFVTLPAAAKTDLPATTGGTAQQAPDYLIDAQGFINFPLIGAIQAAGLSTQQLRDTLTRRVSAYVQHPIVNVRLVSFRFSVLGEVGRPGTYSINNERINVLQALGTAGDLTNYANREKVLVIRERNGQREYGYLNLHQRQDLFRSPYFYLQQNDLLYIEPLPAKVGATTDATNKYLQWAFPVVSIVSLIVSLTR